ncbi:GyrI-like domain-containing protein [Paenibacillus flagellatus]|uniref:Integron-associated effector binding protein domain-containing protein n=1 Tax=Paenibacillus flagellatus TaxID=2211139 RepID=A0A2V5KTN3_9BACL|nr:GyrI-like domain-containing protein [Paenibacillus flagellatus]PYI52606.1 hypothetical protein DLM86_20770 [Paenibacillus flagellatus]
MRQTEDIQIVTVPAFQALAVRTGTTPDKGGTREAWRKLTEAIPPDDARWADTGDVCVFIPQRQWSREVDTLWVGMAVREFGDVPDGVERIDFPESLCLKARVYGDEARMNETYGAVFGWLEQSAEYELDDREGVLGIEANRLTPVNPLTVPYESIRTFDFDMLYPVRRRGAL